jgi:Na+/melibiose symporter-like transporter
MMFLQNLSFGFQTCVAIMPADALDYQQLQTGERLEGFYGNFNQLIIGLVMIIGGFVIPFILQASEMPDDAWVLAINRIRYKVFRNLNIFTMIVVFLSTIPYLFWDLSEDKHKEIIKQLEKIAKKKNSLRETCN